MSRFAETVKAAVDRAAAAVALSALAPLLAAVALCVRADLGPPVLFRQRRPGRFGAPFELLKFRTMRGGPGSDGERLTRLGRFLRASSLDELPELWNVLRGEMSLVGPRPLLTQYLDRYDDDQARRHAVRPGLTGWAQVNGRNAVDWEERLAMDVWYVDHRSLTLDARIVVEDHLGGARPPRHQRAGIGLHAGVQGDGRCALERAGSAVRVRRGRPRQGGGRRGAGRRRLRRQGLPGRRSHALGHRVERPCGARRRRDARGAGGRRAGGAGHRGQPRTRGAVVARLLEAGMPLATVVHPTAVVAAGVAIGDGTFVAPFAVLHADARVGRACIVNTAAVVEHDCVAGGLRARVPARGPGRRGGRRRGQPRRAGRAGAAGAARRRLDDARGRSRDGRIAAGRRHRLGVPARVRPRPAGPSSSRIYLSPPHMGREERALLLEAFDSNWVAPLGPHVDAFEAEFAARHAPRPRGGALQRHGGAAPGAAAPRRAAGRRGACARRSPSSPARTRSSTRARRRSSSTADEASWNMDPALLAERARRAARRGRLPRAVIVVDLYGQCADYDPHRWPPASATACP